MSQHRVDVVRIGDIEPHPNADTLGVAHVFGYQCCVRLGEYQPDDLVAYIPPDSIVPATEQFAFLGENRRIKVRRLRGVYSQGLIVRAPSDAVEGDDAMEALGITHYEPPELSNMGGENEKPPAGFWPKYDVESWHRHKHLLAHGEPVYVTEKIHGANARFIFLDGQFHVGSHTCWKRQDEKNLWWRAVAKNPWIEEWCRQREGLLLFAEVFGQVQDLKYGAGKNDVFVRVFDVYDRGRYLGVEELMAMLPNEQRVPVLYEGPYDEATVKAFSVGQSTLAENLREGCVIRPVPERSDLSIGRVQLKLVSDQYLSQ